MKKEDTPIVVFYILYFGWLFIITFLTPNSKLLNYFSGAVVIFYFVFLRESWDILLFIAAAMIPILIQVISFHNFQFKFEMSSLQYIPTWLPLSWGTTVVALRKFYILISNARKTYTI